MWSQVDALWYAAPQMFATMSRRNATVFATALLIPSALGVIAIVLFFRWLGRTPAPVAAKRPARGPIPVPAVVDTKLRQDVRHRHALAGLAARAIADAASKADGDVERRVREVQRDIPRGAAHQVVERGARLIEERNFEEALVCYLALLFAAVGEGPDGKPAEGVIARARACRRT